MQARLALAHVPPATLAEDAVVGELVAATFRARAVGRLALGNEMKLLGSWERMHLSSQDCMTISR